MKSFITKMTEWYLGVLNARPLIVTLVSGLIVYFCALLASVGAVIIANYGLLYSLVCLLGASFVLSYHWVMSRYQTKSVVAQFIHLSGALFFMWMALAMPIRYSLLMD